MQVEYCPLNLSLGWRAYSLAFGPLVTPLYVLGLWPKDPCLWLQWMLLEYMWDTCGLTHNYYCSDLETDLTAYQPAGPAAARGLLTETEPARKEEPAAGPVGGAHMEQNSESDRIRPRMSAAHTDMAAHSVAAS